MLLAKIKCEQEGHHYDNSYIAREISVDVALAGDWWELVIEGPGRLLFCKVDESFTLGRKHFCCAACLRSYLESQLETLIPDEPRKPRVEAAASDDLEES